MPWQEPFPEEKILWSTEEMLLETLEIQAR
jgi:hypothetical protein